MPLSMIFAEHILRQGPSLCWIVQLKVYQIITTLDSLVATEIKTPLS